MVELPPVPNPPTPQAKRFDAQGKPTTAQVEYETKMLVLLKAIKAAIEALP